MAQTLTQRQQAYRVYLRGPRWRFVRWVRKLLDLGACQDCLREGRITRRGLQVHHTNYRHKGGSLWGEIADCTTLCDRHHAARHGKAAR